MSDIMDKKRIYKKPKILVHGNISTITQKSGEYDDAYDDRSIPT
jgi:hypothetical protein